MVFYHVFYGYFLNYYPLVFFDWLGCQVALRQFAHYYLAVIALGLK